MFQIDENDRDSQCFIKAKKKGEPTFTLRAQDLSSVDTIRFWLTQNPQLSEDRKQETRDRIADVERWQQMHHTSARKAD